MYSSKISDELDERLVITHRFQELIDLFNQTFFTEFNTKLVKGDDEPIYLPANENVNFHRIIFAHGFFASALHEISHWCVAGPARRLQEDFGYWYLPDGRNAAQQAKFEQAEVKPQAVEWALSMACNKEFDVSIDNLHGDCEPDRFAFRQQVYQQVNAYCQHGFPPQAQTFIKALTNFYQVAYPLTFSMFEQQQQAFEAKYGDYV